VSPAPSTISDDAATLALTLTLALALALALSFAMAMALALAALTTGRHQQKCMSPAKERACNSVSPNGTLYASLCSHTDVKQRIERARREVEC